MIKTLTKVSIEGTFLNIIKAIYLGQTHSKYNTQWRKAESFPTKIWNKTRMPTLTAVFIIVLEVLAMESEKQKK